MCIHNLAFLNSIPTHLEIRQAYRHSPMKSKSKLAYFPLNNQECFGGMQLKVKITVQGTVQGMSSAH